MNASKLANYTNVKARELWKTLYLCAKESATRRFHALYDKVYRPDILAEAWRRDLRLSKKKSRFVNIWNDTDGCDFLGFHNRKFPVRNKGGSEIYVATSQASRP